MTDENGTVLNRYVYDAFGNQTIREETVQNRFGFTGEICDGLTGQYYLRARFYNPVIGRFLNEDTYYGDGLNLYSYCHNNPVNYVDPSGHDDQPKSNNAQGGNTSVMTPADKAKSWQGTELYPGVDSYVNSQLHYGDKIYILESDYEVINQKHSGYAVV